MRIVHPWTSFRRVLGFSVVVLAVACPSEHFAQSEKPKTPAQSNAEIKLPSARALTEKFIETLGGREAFAKIKSQRATGRFSMPAQGLGGDLEIFAARPDKILVKISIPGIGDIVQGYDGKAGWSINPATGPDVMEGKQLDQIRDQADFDAILHNEGQIKSMETLGLEEFEGKLCYKVKVIKRTGQEVIEYYDKETSLLRGFLVTVESPLGAIATTNVLSEYKKFGGFLFATRITQKMGPLEQVMDLSTFEINQVDPSVFTPPEEIKALLKP